MASQHRTVDIQRIHGGTASDICRAAFHELMPQLEEAFNTRMIHPLSRIPDSEERDADADALRGCWDAAMEVVLEALTATVLKLNTDEQFKRKVARSLLVRRSAEIISVTNNQTTARIIERVVTFSSEQQDAWLANAERVRRRRRLSV
ncbi:MAG: hypothetical protein Q9165_001506 [Trypethelium subeluteriae]